MIKYKINDMVKSSKTHIRGIVVGYTENFQQYVVYDELSNKTLKYYENELNYRYGSIKSYLNIFRMICEFKSTINAMEMVLLNHIGYHSGHDYFNIIYEDKYCEIGKHRCCGTLSIAHKWQWFYPNDIELTKTLPSCYT